MKSFKHYQPDSIESVTSILSQYKERAKPVAGGTDILGTLKDQIHPVYPEALVNLKTVSGLAGIEETAEGLRIGAMTRLTDLVNHPMVKERYPVLAEAAKAVASPQIRNMATIAGNICQEPRCWYYRNPDNTFYCLRKGGQTCNALVGENRYHSIFGAAHVTESPCMVNCPAGTDIPSYMETLRAGDIAGAAAILLQVNPLPSITGRVCPHFCQEECNRDRYDEAVSIRNVERYLGDYILDHPGDLMTPPDVETGKRVAVVGSGPAGLAAAYYLRMSGHRVVVYDRQKEAGGMLAHALPAYRLPKDVVKRTVRAIAQTGVEFRLGVEVGKEVTLANLEKEYDGLFLAVGAWSQPTIGVEGEKLTQPALDFLTGAVRGEVQTAGPRVMVIGGGNVAVDAAMTALRLGARQVTMACLESRAEMPALEWEVDQALEEGVELMTSWGPSRIYSENEKVTSIELVRCVSVFDNLGCLAPAYDQTVKTMREVDQVILAVGLRTDLSGLNLEGTLDTARGLITVDPETQATNKPTIWAGGDVTSGPATIIEAIASGRRAAQAIDRRLGGTMEAAAEKAAAFPQPLKSFNPDFFQMTPAVPMPIVPLGKRRLDREDAGGYGTEAVQVEANRCFNCGCVAVSPSDVSVALIALDATIRTTRRTIAAEQFFAARERRSTVLEDDELVTEILIPAAKPGTRQTFLKFRIRKSIDFPIASVAVVYSKENGTTKDARIVLGAAAPTPFRALAAERSLNGQAPNVQAAEAAAEAAIQGVMPLQNNGFKVQVFKTLVKRAILS